MPTENGHVPRPYCANGEIAKDSRRHRPIPMTPPAMPTAGGLCYLVGSRSVCSDAYIAMLAANKALYCSILYMNLDSWAESSTVHQRWWLTGCAIADN
jgi:hypothetical protein